MELNKQNSGHSIYFERSYTSGSLKKSTCSDYFFTSTEVLQNSQNFILILSQDGRLKNMSGSLSNVLGYSEDELLAGPVNNLLAQGQFVLNNQLSDYYFQSKFRCKGGDERTIVWRLIPDLLINAFVFVGWESGKQGFAPNSLR